MNKRGVSALIAYVLLIAMGVTAAGIVYTGVSKTVDVKNYVSCPEAVDLSIRDYQCTLYGSFCLTVSNKGRFNASGYIVRVDNRTPRGPDLYVINESGSNVFTGENIKFAYPFPIEYNKEDGEYGEISIVSYVEIQPTRINDRGKVELCEEVITQQISCQVNGFDCMNRCEDNFECPSGICFGNKCVECLQDSDCSNDSNECTIAKCMDNFCIQESQALKPCEDGTGFCAANGTCVSADCTSNSDCESCGAFGANYCIGDNVYHNKTCFPGACLIGMCSPLPSTLNESLVIDCASLGLTCYNGACIAIEEPWKADIFIIMDDTSSLNFNRLWAQIEGLSSWISADLYSWSLPDEENALVGFVNMYDSPMIYDYNKSDLPEQSEWPGSGSGMFVPYSNGFGNYLGNPNRFGMMGSSSNSPLVGPYYNVVYGAWKFMDGWPYAEEGRGTRNIRDGIDIARIVLSDNNFDRPDEEYPDYIFLITNGLPRKTSVGIYENDTCPTVFWASPNNYTCHINEARQAASRAKADGITIYTLGLTYDAEDLDDTTTLQQQRDNLTRFLRDDISSGPAYSFTNSSLDNDGIPIWVMMDQIRHNPVIHVGGL